MRKTAIIVPCYNEAGRLQREAFLSSARAFGLSFLFVNDGSRDGTLDILKGMRDADPLRISYLNLERNSGKAEAVRRGVLKAASEGYDYIGYWDADLATPLEEIPGFVDILDRGAVLVMASRVRLLGRHIERNPLRHYLGRVFATFASLMLGIPVYDTQCGAKLFRNTPELKTAFGRPFSVKWTFDVELFARLRIIERSKGNADYSRGWVEFPIERWVDVKGSKVKRSDFIKGGAEFLKVFSFLFVPVIKERYARTLLDG